MCIRASALGAARARTHALKSPRSADVPSGKTKKKKCILHMWPEKLASRGWWEEGGRKRQEKRDKDTGEETATRPDQYTNTNADRVIDKPPLTTGGRTLSAIIG